MTDIKVARLIYSCANGEKYEVDLVREEISIGRRDDNHICLFDGLISKYHAIIRKEEDGKYFIRDKNSANGVRVNEKLIETAKMIMLNDNDMIEFGPFLMTFIESIAPLVSPVYNARSSAIITPASRLDNEHVTWAVDMTRLLKREQREAKQHASSIKAPSSNVAVAMAQTTLETKLTMIQIFMNRDAAPYRFEDFLSYLKITVYPF